jgi:hypothetical protein
LLLLLSLGVGGVGVGVSRLRILTPQPMLAQGVEVWQLRTPLRNFAEARVGVVKRTEFTRVQDLLARGFRLTGSVVGCEVCGMQCGEVFADEIHRCLPDTGAEKRFAARSDRYCQRQWIGTNLSQLSSSDSFVATIC